MTHEVNVFFLLVEKILMFNNLRSSFVLVFMPLVRPHLNAQQGPWNQPSQKRLDYLPAQRIHPFCCPLKGVLGSAPSGDCLVLLGDFNAHAGIDSVSWRGVIGKNDPLP